MTSTENQRRHRAHKRGDHSLCVPPSRCPVNQPHRQLGLTSREFQIIAGLAEGRRLRHMADDLFISYTTAKNHYVRARQKLGANTPAHVVSIAYRAGILPPPAIEER